MQVITSERNGYILSSDHALLDIALIHDFLSNRSYWAQGIPYEVVASSIEHALCFGIYNKSKQVAFARVITDFSTIAYLGDVFVIEEQRGKGLSKWLMDEIIAHPQLQNLRRWILATKDAHALYNRSGFIALAKPERFMEKADPDIYLRLKT
jgi:GNAT superfamily N-acetyltransferase